MGSNNEIDSAIDNLALFPVELRELGLLGFFGCQFNITWLYMITSSHREWSLALPDMRGMDDGAWIRQLTKFASLGLVKARDGEAWWDVSREQAAVLERLSWRGFGEDYRRKAAFAFVSAGCLFGQVYSQREPMMVVFEIDNFERARELARSHGFAKEEGNLSEILDFARRLESEINPIDPRSARRFGFEPGGLGG